CLRRGTDHRDPRGLSSGGLTQVRARGWCPRVHRFGLLSWSPRSPAGVAADGNALRYAAVLTNDQIQDARRRAALQLQEAGFVLTDEERDAIEVADFGLSELE